MRFKITKIAMLLFSLISSALQAEEFPRAHVLGMAIHPTFFQHLIEYLNENHHSFDIEQCLKPSADLQIRGKLSATWSLPKFQSGSGNFLSLETQVSDFRFEGQILDSCGVNSKPLTPIFSLSLDKASLKFYLSPENMNLQIEKDTLLATAAALKPSIGNFPKISKLTDTVSWKEALLAALMDRIELNVSNQVREKLRGLVFLQSLYEVTKNSQLSSLWKEGPIFKHGALTLELDQASEKQKEILFGFVPFAKNSLIASPNGLEFYVNALFLNHDHLTNLTGFNVSKADPALVLSKTRSVLLDIPSWLPSSYQRAELPEVTSEMNMVLPSSLINEAFDTVYRERLLGFTAKINLAEQTRDLVAEGAPEVYQLIRMSPQTAPKIHFQPDRLQLEISDYALEIGTFMENRLIPSTQVTAHATVSVTLKVDNQAQTLNLALLPDTFQVTLKDNKNRLVANDLDVFKRVAEGLWQDFIKTNSELVLFPTVLQSAKAPVRISQVRVSGETLLLDMDVDWKSVKL
jgi:hypothetical protein